MVHKDRGDIEMMVKGIESAKSQSVTETMLLSRHSLSRTRPRVPSYLRLTTAMLLAMALILSVAVTPYRAATLAEESRKDDRDNMRRDGRKAIRQGKYEQAIKLYQQLLESDPSDIDARLGISLAYLKDMNYLLCFEQAKEALKIDPNNARGHALAGFALIRSGYIAPAVYEIVQAVKLDPKEPMGHGAAAEVDYFEGRCEDARTRSFRAFKLDPDEPDYLMTFARASSRIERFNDAADAYERFLEIAPKTDHDRRDRIEGLIHFYRKLAGISIHDVGGAKTTDVPFHLGSDRRPYIDVKLNGRDARFVIDTGSGFTVISKEAAKRFKVSELARGGTSQGVGGDGQFKIVYGLINSIELGDAKIKAVPCFIRPFHGSKEKGDAERADGFIGLSILSHFLTELDYHAEVMRLDRSNDKTSQVAFSPDAAVIPFRTTQNGLISIETELDNNHRINAILDSGASSTVISVAAVDRLNLRESIIKGQTVSVVGAAGISDNVPLLLIRHCRVAAMQQENLRALVLSFDAINETAGFEQSGILGGDFLRNFRVTIDFINTRLIFDPTTATLTRQ